MNKDNHSHFRRFSRPGWLLSLLLLIPLGCANLFSSIYDAGEVTIRPNHGVVGTELQVTVDLGELPIEPSQLEGITIEYDWGDSRIFLMPPPITVVNGSATFSLFIDPSTNPNQEYTLYFTLRSANGVGLFQAYGRFFVRTQ